VRKRERERIREGWRDIVRKSEKEICIMLIEFISLLLNGRIVIFIFKRNDGCLGESPISANVRLVCKNLPLSNTSAYFDQPSHMTKKVL
jgi:hypothetical protein